MFFALAMLFCLGNIQGNPVAKPNVQVEYILDQSLPVFTIVAGSDLVINSQLERGASVQILELNQAQSVNERFMSTILYINIDMKTKDYASDLGLRYTSSNCSPTESKAYIAEVNNFRAREKV